MGSESRNVFISHVGEDDSGLKPLKSLLSNAGVDVKDYSITSDKENNAKSESYIKGQILAPRISACSVLVVYVSPLTKDSAYVNWEIEYAQKEGKRIVGVWAHGENGCEVPSALAEFGDAVVGWHGNSIVDAINGRNGWEQPDGSQTNARQIARYTC